MEVSWDVKLTKLGKDAKTIDGNVYGSIITNENDSSRELCGLNKNWGDPNSNPYTGIAANWVYDLHLSTGKAIPHTLNYNDETVVIKAMEIGSSRFSRYHADDIFNIKSLRETVRKNAKLANSCLGISNIDYNYMGLDDFANGLINSKNVRHALDNVGMKDILSNDIMMYSLCNRYSLLVSSYANRGDLRSFAINPEVDEIEIFTTKKSGRTEVTNGIKYDIIRDIIGEVCITLSTLQEEIQLVHGDLKVQNIFLHKRDIPITVSRRDLTIKSQYEVRIADFGNASSTLPGGKVRIFNENRSTRAIPSALGLTDYKLKGDEKQSSFIIKLGEPTTDSANNIWWKLGMRFNTVVSLITSHSGMPYYKSYDFYVFMVSLMCVPQYYNTIIGTNLYGIWASMWMDSERDKVTSDCMKMHKSTPSLDKIVSLLRKYNMSCQAVDTVMKLLTTHVK
jgi:serine/threonine protein kinase